MRNCFAYVVKPRRLCVLTFEISWSDGSAILLLCILCSDDVYSCLTGEFLLLFKSLTIVFTLNLCSITALDNDN